MDQLSTLFTYLGAGRLRAGWRCSARPSGATPTATGADAERVGVFDGHGVEGQSQIEAGRRRPQLHAPCPRCILRCILRCIFCIRKQRWPESLRRSADAGDFRRGRGLSAPDPLLGRGAAAVGGGDQRNRLRTCGLLPGRR